MQEKNSIRMDLEAIKTVVKPFTKYKGGAIAIGKKMGLKGEELELFNEAIQFMKSEHNAAVRYGQKTEAAGHMEIEDMDTLQLLWEIGHMDGHDPKYELAFQRFAAALEGRCPPEYNECDHGRTIFAVMMFITGFMMPKITD